MRLTVLRWAVGMLCVLLGAIALIVPHRFGMSAAPLGLHTHLLWWGVAFLVVGIGLPAAPVLAPSRRPTVIAQLAAGLVLLVVALDFTWQRLWLNGLNYGVLGLVTMLAPALPGVRDTGPGRPERDLLSLAIGFSAALEGAAMLTVPALLRGPAYDLVRVSLPFFSAAFIVSGLTLAAAQFRPARSPIIAWTPYLCVAVTFLGFARLTMMPGGTWTGSLYHGGFGLLLASLPWTLPALARHEDTSLRVRLALALTVAVAAPVIAVGTIVTARNERAATSQALTEQAAIAGTLADDISRYLTFHRAAAVALAKAINISRMNIADQEALLRTLGEDYPDVYGFTTYDERGHPLARGDAQARESINGTPVFEQAFRTNGTSLAVNLSPVGKRLVFDFGTPLRRPDNSWAGLLVLSVESARVAAAVSRVTAEAGSRAYLVNGEGRILIHPDAELNGSLLDVSNTPPVISLLSDKASGGVIRYPSRLGEQLAGYARVAGTSWGVIVERPVAVALAGARGGRDLAFAILVLLMGGAALGGTIAAGMLARPLEALAYEAKRLGEHQVSGELPRSSIAEVRDLSATFGEMSARLAERTRERAAAEEGLRRQNAYLSALHETSLGLMNRLDLKDLLETIVIRAGELVGTSSGNLYLLDRNAGELDCKVSIGSATMLRRTKLKRGEGVAGRVWASGEPLVIDDYDVWPGRVPNSPLGLQHAVCGIPMKTGDQVVGVMVLRDSEPGRRFAPETVALLGRFVQLAALALDNAQLIGAVREREARIRSIMDSTSDGFIFVGRDGRIMSVSQRAKALLSAGEAWGVGSDFARAMAELNVRPAHRDAVVAALRSQLGDGAGTAAGDLELGGGGGVLHWDAQPARDDRGGFVGLTFTIHDVTQEREVSRMKSDFVSFVTHQLRTPLAGIKWLLELAAGTQDVEELQAYIEDARAANERLVTLVNDLLDISRLESGRLVVTPQELDLGKMTRSVVDELTPLLNDKGHQLRVEGTDALPLVMADPQLLRQVVMNLISNAIKYTPPPGQIALRMRAENGSVEWAVQDNGIGIPKDALPRLFEKFYRADNVHKIETEGTGLGLYLVRLIVERFGGRIWCESEEGKGSTFLFTVPLSGGNDP